MSGNYSYNKRRRDERRAKRLGKSALLPGLDVAAELPLIDEDKEKAADTVTCRLGLKSDPVPRLPPGMVPVKDLHDSEADRQRLMVLLVEIREAAGIGWEVEAADLPHAIAEKMAGLNHERR